METGEIEILERRISNVEHLLEEINAKIENFMGYEELTDDEEREVEEILNEIKEGKYKRFEELF